MAIGFEATASGRYVGQFDADERNVLTMLAGDLITYVGPDEPSDSDPFGLGISDDAEISDDPALARLYPHAYRSDYEAATEFRRYTEQSIRQAKAAHLHTLIASLEKSGDKVTLNADEAHAWASAVNDMRLVIGTRLHLDPAEQDDPEDIEPEYVEQMQAVYQWLTWLQETLIEALLGAEEDAYDLVDHDDDDEAPDTIAP